MGNTVWHAHTALCVFIAMFCHISLDFLLSLAASIIRADVCNVTECMVRVIGQRHGIIGTGRKHVHVRALLDYSLFLC